MKARAVSIFFAGGGATAYGELIRLREHLRVQFVRLAAVFLLFLLATAGATAQQQTTGVPGSAGATTTIEGKQLPAPPPKFGGVIKETLQGSKTWWPPR
jgi:arylsulfatase